MINNDLIFDEIGDLIGDWSLIKGCFPIEQPVTLDLEEDDMEDAVIRKVAVLYDCHLLYFDDEDGEIYNMIKNKLLDKAVTLQNN